MNHALAHALRAARETVSALEDAEERELTAEEWLLLFAELGRREAELHEHLAALGEQAGLPTAGKARLLRYLTLTMGKVVTKDELSGVAGIYEWARRLRELRLEGGWPIASNETRIDLRPGEYVLERGQPDLLLKERWQQMNAIRRQRGSATDRLAAFFRAHAGKVVTADELFYVSRIHSFPRRVRELTERGWDIASNLDEPELKPGEYIFKGTA